MQIYTLYLYLKTSLLVSGGSTTHHQERIQLYLQHLVFVRPLLLAAAIVEEVEPVSVCCGRRTPPTAQRFPGEMIQAEENTIKFRLKMYSLKNIYIHNLNFVHKLTYNLCGWHFYCKRELRRFEPNID